MDYDVFLSHNSKDKPAVEQIGRLLAREYAVTCWLDKWNLVPGEPWQEGLEEALDQCQTIAIFVGANTISPWENEEMRSALETRTHNKTRRVIPVLLPGASDSKDLALPRFLSRLTWVDFRSGLDDKEALYRLYCGIKGISPGDNGVDNKEKRAFIQMQLGEYLQRIPMKIKLGLLMAFVIFLAVLLYVDLPIFCGNKLSTSSAYIFQAKNQREEGKYACAIKSIARGLQLDPNPNQKLNLYYVLASIYIAKDDPAKALEYTNLGLTVNGDDESAIANLHLSKAITYCQMQQNIDAVQEFDSYFELNPTPGDLISIEATKIRNDLDIGKNMNEDCLITLGVDLLP